MYDILSTCRFFRTFTQLVACVGMSEIVLAVAVADDSMSVDFSDSQGISYRGAQEPKLLEYDCK